LTALALHLGVLLCNWERWEIEDLTDALDFAESEVRRLTGKVAEGDTTRDAIALIHDQLRCTFEDVDGHFAQEEEFERVFAPYWDGGVSPEVSDV
jgi:hypothetical protein